MSTSTSTGGSRLAGEVPTTCPTTLRTAAQGPHQSAEKWRTVAREVLGDPGPTTRRLEQQSSLVGHDRGSLAGAPDRALAALPDEPDRDGGEQCDQQTV